MSTSATRDEIRVAYRRLAREHHPDTKGDASAVRMAQINEAWRV
ncbi:MAG: DnaJ domain, partial [Ilumatobacteraceae bacterium]|nr:DnaJ domain [Ilumatobacteraceae bacterium]